MIQHVILLGLIVLGFALRLTYLTSTHPFFDEYTTVLAARQILQHGWPVLPSGLFYEHGLLFTYLTAPFTALFITAPLNQWQPAHWGLMLSRWPSLLLGTATIPLLYHVGQRLDRKQSPIWLLAAGLFALSPEGMVWGGRARMYALATLLVLLTVYWAYRGAIYPAPAQYRWAALGALLATLLTQFGALMLIPPLVIALGVVGWLSHRQAGGEIKPWFWQPSMLLEGTALAFVIGTAILVKRLGRPIGMADLGSDNTGSLLHTLLDTVAYQTAFHFTWPDTVAFLARQFGVPHHLWLTILVLGGSLVGVLIYLVSFRSRRRRNSDRNRRETEGARISPLIPQDDILSSLFALFLWLTFALIIIEMITLLQPFRRNPRYLVMYLPLFYLMAAWACSQLWRLLPAAFHLKSYQTVTVILVLTLLTIIGFDDLRIALRTPEPAYEQAFAHIQQEWQAGDSLLTMNTPAAGLYQGEVAGFAVQTDADQFLLNRETVPVDRWLGVPWLGTAADFNAALNGSERTWFVIDTIRQPVYFRGDWLALLNNQMEQVWAFDNALIYRTRPDRTPLPTQPDTLVNATLGESIELIGYSLSPKFDGTISNLHLTLFWHTLAPLPTDYTIFLHLRNQAGSTVAQRDGQPLEGAYPTSRWQPGETIIDPLQFSLPDDLPPGEYQFYIGMYHLETLERLPVHDDVSGENAILLGAISIP